MQAGALSTAMGGGKGLITGGTCQAWRDQTISLIARRLSTCERVMGEGSEITGVGDLATGKGVRWTAHSTVEDGPAPGRTLIPTSRSQVDLSTCLFPCFRGRGRTSREGAVGVGV